MYRLQNGEAMKHVNPGIGKGLPASSGKSAPLFLLSGKIDVRASKKRYAVVAADLMR
jgi:hypothetical protein